MYKDVYMIDGVHVKKKRASCGRPEFCAVLASIEISSGDNVPDGFRPFLR